MSTAQLLRAWVPGSLIIGPIILAMFTPLNPWIIGACAGALILLSLGADWLSRRGPSRDRETTDPDRAVHRPGDA